jgi:CheY-like chemotaxis protein/HPt (histidine-containing phosphotransfer) domain-containing protein
VHIADEVEDLTGAEAPTVEEALRRGTLVLVAEDNPVNRDVIGRQLKLLGYACEMAEDGALALKAWRSKKYGILLTDCHMPNMDGFQLTAAIRKGEKDGGRHATIVAITANALQGEAERCLAAGMDDYMSKPVDLKVLRDKLRKWLPQTRATDKAAPKAGDGKSKSGGKEKKAKPKADAKPIDERTLKDVFGDDDATFREILGGFVAPSKEIVGEIVAGWKDRSAEAITRSAHKLKSSARSVGANALADLCTCLESAGREGDWSVIDGNIGSLEPLMSDVERFIANL